MPTVTYVPCFFFFPLFFTSLRSHRHPLIPPQSKLNAEELKKWLKDQEAAMGDPEQRMSDEEIDSTVKDLVLETDSNGDGAVSLEEILVASDEPPQ